MSAKTLPGNTQTSHHHQQQQHYQQPTTRPLFLVLVDDNRGSNHQGGAYAATFVTLQHCVFTVSKLTTPPFLPTFQECHVSCITYHERCGFVLCVGKRLWTIPPSPFFEDASVSSSNTLARMVGGRSKQRRGRYNTQQRQLAMATVIDFSATALPPPCARGGQDSLIVTAQG